MKPEISLKNYSLLDLLKNPYFISVCLGLAVVSFFYVDIDLAVYFQSYRFTHLLQFKFFSQITKLGSSLPYIIGSLILFLWAFFIKKDKSLARAALYILSAVIISGLICDAIKIIAGRARPTLYFSQHLYGFYFWEFTSRLQSFPSGHATTIAAFATACSLLWPRVSWLLLILTLLVTASRLVVGAHYLSDVIIGAYLGFFISFALYQIPYLKKIGSISL